MNTLLKFVCRWWVKPTLLLVVGCQSAAPTYEPVTAKAGGNEVEQQMEFWHQLADKPVTTYDDAFHALLLFTDGDDPAADYAGRTQALKSRKMLADGFNRPGNEAVDRGTLSVALSRVLQIKGGVVMSLFGPSPRYATKELEFLEIYPSSSPNQTFSGSEFVAVISRAEEYQTARRVRDATHGGTYVPPEMDRRTATEQAGQVNQGAASRPAAPATQPVSRQAS